MFHGAVLVDKPPGMTSAAVLRKLERAWGQRGLGHAGTLDPMATGLLVVLCGAATRLQMLFLDSEKVYSGSIRIGLGTTTDDIEGDTISADGELRFKDERSLESWRDAIICRFSGAQLQVPPQFSAIKVGGRRSYDLARKGKSPELDARTVQVDFEALEFHGPERLSYRVRCSKGTYVRSLARDIGAYLGTAACLESIRRLSSASMTIAGAHTLEALLQAEPAGFLIGIDELVAGLPAFRLDEPDCVRLKRGVQVPLSERSPEGGERGGLAAIFCEDGTFQGMAERSAEMSNWKVRFMLP